MDEHSKASVGKTVAQRSGERRGPDRRTAEQPFAGDERRTGERRSGRERRADRD